jgi:hypothetical protein
VKKVGQNKIESAKKFGVEVLSEKNYLAMIE